MALAGRSQQRRALQKNEVVYDVICAKASKLMAMSKPVVDLEPCEAVDLHLRGISAVYVRLRVDT